jgi:Fe-S-cluster containining protein
MQIANIEQVMQDMKHGVYNFTQNGKCINCGNCCTALLPITKEELKTIQRFVKRKHLQIEKHTVADVDLTCPFRNEEKRICMIYNIGPQICRDFKCDKPQKKTDDTKEHYEYDNRFSVLNLREIFK